MVQLVAAFANLLIFSQNPIHRAPRAQVALFIQQGGIHFAGCLILKAFAVQHLAHRRFFRRGQRTRRRWTLWGRAGRDGFDGLLRPIEAPARESHGFASRYDSEGGCQGFDRLDHARSSFRLGSVGKPSNCETFF